MEDDLELCGSIVKAKIRNISQGDAEDIARHSRNRVCQPHEEGVHIER